jgi:hypothetical protein
MRWRPPSSLWFAIVAGGCAAVATYALNDLIADVNDTVLSTLRGVAAYHDAPPDSDGTLRFSTHEPSLCCEPFIQGLRLLAMLAFWGGVPMAVIALLTLRLRGRTRTMLGRALARAGFVLQLFSVCLWTMAFAMLVWADSDNSVEFESGRWILIGAAGAIWLVHTLIGVLGTRAWWRLADSDPDPIALFARPSA